MTGGQSFPGLFFFKNSIPILQKEVDNQDAVWYTVLGKEMIVLETSKRITTKTIVYIGVFAALTAVLSQVALPLPTNVPITLQTFAVALAGYFLGWAKGGAALAVYVLLGGVGVPVFSGFKGGFSVLTGPTGGFIFGFVPMAVICGLAVKLFSSKKPVGKLLIVTVGIAGLLVDHAFGTVWYSISANISFWKSIMLVSLPFLVKDIISVAAAYVISVELLRRLRVKA